MMDETDQSQQRQDKFVRRVRTRGYELLRSSLRELFYEQTSKKQEALPSCGLLAAKCHTRGSRFRDQSVFLVGNGALDVADRVAPPHHRSFRFELCLPHRSKESDFQFHGSKGFIWGESTGKRYAHRGISDIAKDTAVQCSHRICMLWSGCQDDRRPPVSDVFHLKSNQTRDWNVVRFCSFSKVRLRGNFLSTHDLSAPAFDFRARTSVSRYSSRWRHARSRGSSFRCRRLTIWLPSRVLAIKVANFAETTSERTSPRRFPSSAIDCRRSSQELRAWRALARNFGLPSSESMAVFNNGQPPGTSPVRRSRKFRTICLRRSTVFGISSVPWKRVSIAIFHAWSKASPASSCLLPKCR